MNSNLTPKENQILETCKKLCNEDGFFTIGNRRLSQLTDVDYRKLNQYLGELTEKGYLSPSVRFGPYNTYIRQIISEEITNAPPGKI
jgi:hypothetical protein